LDCALVRTGEKNDRMSGTALEGRFLVFVSTPLAYVEWFTPFSTPDLHTGLYTLTRSTRQHKVYAQIIEANRIVRNCHLQPKYGCTKDPTWTTDNVMD
ncbi:hypothetical protein EV421DRAFT_1677906, partial [Armillaria borealis]